MVRRPARGHQDSAAKGRSFKALPRRNPRDPLTVSMKLRGGPEAWVELHARGSVLRCPGYVTVAEALFWINNV